MSARKKYAIGPRQAKQGQLDSDGQPVPPEIKAMLMVGTEHIDTQQEDNENIGFMAEFIDPG